MCTEIGACDVEQFDFVTEPLDYTQDQWDDKCYVCQAFAKDLEVCVSHVGLLAIERLFVTLLCFVVVGAGSAHSSCDRRQHRALSSKHM